MKKSHLSLPVVYVALFLSLATGAVFLLPWINPESNRNLELSLPGQDDAPFADNKIELEVNIEGQFETFDGQASDLPGTWPRFRGPESDNICRNGASLMDKWPEDGPKVIWSIKLGEGHAAAAVLNGRIYLLDYDEERRGDALRCLSLNDGREIWRRFYKVPAKRNHGLSRTIPAVTAKWVVTLGPRCQVMCVNSVTGEFRWGIDLLSEYGTTEPLWFAGQCPLIDGETAILAPAGTDTLMMGVDCGTGEVLWQTANVNGWKMSHSSIIPMTIFGKKMYVYCAIGGILGVSADGKGEMLWKLPWNKPVVAPSPVQLSDNRIFITAGYGGGGRMIQVEKTASGFEAKTIADNSPKEWLASEQQTPIYHEGLLYGIMPKDSGALRQQFVCYDPDSKKLVWASGKSARFGLGPFLLADNKFFILSDDGVLTMIPVSREKYTELARHKILDGHDAWGPIAIAGTRMLMRDSKRMVCIDVGKDAT